MSGILIEAVGQVGYITLAQKASLNALTLDMIEALHEGLTTHESNSTISCIVLRSASPRAFCAGGDMKRVRQLAIDGKTEDIRQFFTKEYALNLAIAQCTKPYISLIDGIAMGGGLGLSIHGTYVIATEKTVMAMPESRIGFFPDVGASHFLRKMNHECTTWFALTAAPLKGSQTVTGGLATHFIDSAKVTDLLTDLEQLGSAATNTVSETASASTSGTSVNTPQTLIDRILEKYTNTVSDAVFEKQLKQRAEWFSGNDISVMKERLIGAASENEDARHLLSLLESGSPYSYKITLELLQRTSNMNLEKCLQEELKLAFEATTHPDLIEGVRAVLVDKDHKPEWQ